MLHRWREGLDDEHIGLPAVGLELHATAIVAERRRGRGAERNLEASAQSPCQVGMRMPAEDDDSAHARGASYSTPHRSKFGEFGRASGGRPHGPHWFF